MSRTKLTVGELKEIIANLPNDMEVVIQRDSEGNGYETAYAADPDCIWDLYKENILSTDLAAAENCMEEDEWEKLKAENPRVLVIAP